MHQAIRAWVAEKVSPSVAEVRVCVRTVTSHVLRHGRHRVAESCVFNAGCDITSYLVAKASENRTPLFCSKISSFEVMSIAGLIAVTNPLGIPNDEFPFGRDRSRTAACLRASASSTVVPSRLRTQANWHRAQTLMASSSAAPV